MTETGWIKTNQEILENIEEQRSHVAMTEKKKARLFAHIMTRNNFITNILERKHLNKKRKEETTRKDDIQPDEDCWLLKLSRNETMAGNREDLLQRQGIIFSMCSQCVC